MTQGVPILPASHHPVFLNVRLVTVTLAAVR